MSSRGGNAIDWLDCNPSNVACTILQQNGDETFSRPTKRTTRKSISWPSAPKLITDSPCESSLQTTVANQKPKKEFQNAKHYANQRRKVQKGPKRAGKFSGISHRQICIWLHKFRGKILSRGWRNAFWQLLNYANDGRIFFGSWQNCRWIFKV